MNANELIYYSHGRPEGDRKREKGKKKMERSIPNDKREFGFLGRMGSLSLGIFLWRKEALAQG